jgi:hypothetical protein
LQSTVRAPGLSKRRRNGGTHFIRQLSLTTLTDGANAQIPEPTKLTV